MTFALAAAAGVALLVPADLPAQADTPSALSEAQRLTVKGRAPKTGYDRAKFGTAWTDNNAAPWGHNGCSTRFICTWPERSRVLLQARGVCGRLHEVRHVSYRFAEDRLGLALNEDARLSERGSVVGSTPVRGA